MHTKPQNFSPAARFYDRFPLIKHPLYATKPQNFRLRRPYKAQAIFYDTVHATRGNYTAPQAKKIAFSMMYKVEFV